jgi:AcrR family transcriptional regulator
MVKFAEIDSTQEKILDAAKEIFIKKGMYGARMQEIADRAGINKALLHYYFRSKNKLFDAIFEEAFQDFLPKAFAVLEGDKPLEDKIRAFVANYIDILSRNPFLPIFIINEVNQNPDRLGRIVNMMSVIRSTIADQVQEKVAAGEYRQIEPVQLFSSIVSLTIFPFLAKPIIFGAFDYSEQQFQQFLNERKTLVPDIIINYLKIKDRS